jgi:O-antigen/teichoic acid export membrane protein
MPPASEAAARHDYRRLYSLFIKALGTTAAISLVIIIIVLLFSKLFLQLWMGTEFMHHSLSMFQILLVGYAIFSVNAPAFFIANGMGSPWVCSMVMILGGSLTIVLIFILGGIWNLNGVAWANWAYIINFMITFYVFWKLKNGLKKATI